MTALERAARAVAVEYYTAPTDDQYDKDVASSQWESFVPLVRAVLLAVREPGNAAVDAYFDKCRELGFSAHINASCAMETMIGAILSEGAA